MPEQRRDQIARAIEYTLMSPNEVDQNLESANVVDGLFAIARAIRRLAEVLENSKNMQLGQEGR